MLNDTDIIIIIITWNVQNDIPIGQYIMTSMTSLSI